MRLRHALGGSGPAERGAGTASSHRLLRWRRTGDSLLRLPSVGPLVVTSLISSVGTAMAMLAATYLSFRHANSLVHTVMVATAYSLPAAFVGSWAGRLADTRDQRKVVLVSDFIRMCIWIGVAVLDAVGWLNPWWLTVVAFIAGLVSAIQFPSWQKLERRLVPPDRLQEANALFSSAGSIAKLLGAVAGGVLITWVGSGWVFRLDALTYIPLMLMIRRIPDSPPTERPVQRERLRDALRYARHEPTLRLSIRLVIILTVLAVPIANLLPAVAAEMGNEAHYLGLLTAFYGLGGSLVAAVLYRMTKHRAKAQLVSPALLACGVSLVIIGIAGNLPRGEGRQIVVFALLVPIGLGLAMAQAVLSATVQVSASAEMEGQIIALYGAVVSLVAPIGAFALAGIADATTVWLAVAIAGGGLTIVAIAMHLIRQLELITVVTPQRRDVAMAHSHHLGRHVTGFIDPGQFHPLTVRRRRGRSSRDVPSP